MKQYTMMLMFVLGMQAFSQKTATPIFTLPFASTPIFSGNFGEIRSTHFHGGLDFKTGGVVGKPILALADGYISRIQFTHGSGGVLEVNYDNGYTTINRHIESFLEPIAHRIKELQYASEKYEVEIIPEMDEYRVKRGQTIALAGNRGYSFGPHLHLEVKETATGDFIDPIPLFGKYIVDTTAPKAESFMIMPKLGEGSVNGNNKNVIFQPGNAHLNVWGKVGLAVKAFDYMNGANNRCGVHTVTLHVDGQDVYTSVVDRIASNESRQVNSWSYNGYMKSFIDPGNTLRLHHAYNDDNGWINIDQERDYKCIYTLQDASGNTVKYRFTLVGKQQNIQSHTPDNKYSMQWQRTNQLSDLGMNVVFPKGSLYDDVQLNYQLKADSSRIAHIYQLHDKKIMLRDNAQLAIGLRKMPVSDVSKYYIARVTPKGLIDVGGQYEDGYLKTDIRELGTYTIAIDTIGPKIKPVNQSHWASKNKIVYSITDTERKIISYKGMIDGKFALFYRPNMLSSQYICDLDPKYIQKGQHHELELIAIDSSGNETILTETFYW